MTLTDAGLISAVLDADDAFHPTCVATLPAIVPLLTTWPCFVEAMYILRRELGDPGQDVLWEMHAAGQLAIHDSGPVEKLRMRALMDQYRDIPMDLADASLIAAAETHNVRRISTLDGHFYAYRNAAGEPMEVIP